MNRELETNESAKLEIPDQVKPTRFRKTKTFLLLILILLCARLGYFYLLDKPLSPNRDAMRLLEPDANARDASYAENFNARQTDDLLPAADNGWRDVLQALGPKCVQQQAIADQVPWSEIATNERSKEWFETYWKPTCEKFDLDPNAKPTAYDRLTVYAYMTKNGITGDDPEPDPKAYRKYWENGEERDGRVSLEAVNNAYIALMAKPWTEEDYPIAAKWLQENDDLYALVADAVRKPKFAAWHIAYENRAPYDVLFPDVQFERELARLFRIRAFYRLGKGDVSAALDDVETMLRIADACFKRENTCFVEQLVGIAIVGVALALPYGDAQPTADDCRRFQTLAAKYATAEFRSAALERSMRGEKALSINSYLWMLDARRSLDVPDELFDDESSKKSGSPLLKKALRATRPLWAKPYDDEKALRAFYDIWNQYAQASREEQEAIFASMSDGKPTTPIEALTVSDAESAKLAAKLLLPAAHSVVAAFDRLSCVAKTAQISAALLEYQAVNGHLPPAFSVDPDGKPLLSWRVLILPYLGEEEKALYEKLALDQPWDSERNAALLADAPDVFRCPACKLDAPVLACYAALVGKDAFFDESGVGKDLTTFERDENVDSLERALLVECDQPVVWSAPDSNLSYDQLCARFEDGKPLGGEGFLSTVHTTGSQIACAGGAVHFHVLNLRAIEYDEQAQLLLFGKINAVENEQNAEQSDASDVDAPTQHAATPDSLSAE